jgi:glycosyltransferase involved in cell wall biosynthesis
MTWNFNSPRRHASRLSSLRLLREYIAGSAREAAAAVVPYYRHVVPDEVRLLVPEGVRRLAKTTFGIKDPVVRAYEYKLRLNELGFVERALEDLGRLSRSPEVMDRQLALWHLAVWHANRRSRRGSTAALELLDRYINEVVDQELLRRAAVLRAECHATLGDVYAGRAVIAATLQVEQHPDLFLADTNLHEDLAERLTRINEAMRLYRLPRVSLSPDQAASPYDRLTVAEEQLPATTGPKITVIVPAFNAAEHIATSMEALISQTWENIEVLVVDDFSTDSTTDVVTAFADRDPRIRLIRAEVNRGSYVARNIALREASGEFVTTHDSDDWSHPQKLEFQARHLLSNPGVAANMSQQARTTSDLVFHRRGNPGHYIFDNMSSLMFRRKLVLEKLGFWDSVRFGADSEFIERLRRAFGRKAVASVPMLLSFQRQSESSLTASSAFGYPGFHMGARQAYHEASRRYHRGRKNLIYAFSPANRQFAVPEPMRPLREVTRGERRHFDVILVSDFRIPGKLRAHNIAYVEKAMQPGCRVGLIQLADYDFDPTAEVLPAFRDLEDSCGVQFIVFGERVSCHRVVILDPFVLQEYQRFMPDVDAENVEILATDALVQLTSRDDLAGRLDTCMQNARRYFGRPSVWSSEDPALCDLLEKGR